MGVRKYPDVPRVYIDQDGPLAQLEEAAIAAGLTIQIFKCQAGAYVGLGVTPGAAEAIEALEGIGLSVFVLTKAPHANPYSATEKLLWMAKSPFPHLQDRTIISSDKGAVGTARDFLVDDHPEWANADNFPGTVLLFKNNWPELVQQIKDSLALAPAETRHQLALNRRGIAKN